MSLVGNVLMSFKVFRTSTFDFKPGDYQHSHLQRHHTDMMDVTIPLDINWANLWRDLYGLDDATLISELQSRGLPNVMIYPLALGRIEANRKKQEEDYLFETPFWQDASEDLLHLYDRSEARTESIHRNLFGSRWVGLDPVELIRRNAGWKKWRIKFPPYLCSASGQYHMRKDRLESSEFDMIKDILSEEGLQKYRIENSWESRYKASSLEWMQPAQDEFDAIMQYEFAIKEIEKELDSKKANRDPDYQVALRDRRRKLDKRIESTLGDDRFKEYFLLSLQSAPAVMALKDVFGLEEGQAREILQINWNQAERIRNGLSQFPDDSAHHKNDRDRIKSLLSAEAYAALIDTTAHYFPRGFFKE